MFDNVNLSGHVGNIDLIDYPHTAFLCSRNIPSQHINTIIEWAQGITDQKRCMVCGCQSSIEYQILEIFLRNRVPVIIVFSTVIPETLAEEWKVAIDEGRLLILSEHNDEKPTNDAYQRRNALILELSSDIVVGYCTRGGNIAHQMLGRANVTFLTSYSAYDNQDRKIWSKSHRMSDGSTILLSLHTLNQRETYLEITKAYFSHESHKTEYSTIYIPQSDISDIHGLIMDAEMMSNSYLSQREYERKIKSAGNTLENIRMPWDEEVETQIVRLSNEGLNENQISKITGASLNTIKEILDK
ncbi:MAG: hypothetical protein Q4C30_03510 [Bacteroidia bacterium]|nr:hypothetical protein [Bacteroidia bacterium]